MLLIDHQGAQFSGLQSHDGDLVINNATALAKGARQFGGPAILTTVVEDRGGKIISQLQDVFPEQVPIDRTTINAWEDPRVVEAVAATGRRDILMTGLWTQPAQVLLLLLWDATFCPHRTVVARRCVRFA